MHRRNFLLSGAGAIAAASSLPAAAQSYPSKPTKLYCPFTAGGPTDIVFRGLAEVVSRNLGQPVIVENKPGVAGTLPALEMRTAKPDGYTLTQVPMGMFRIPHMQRVQTFNPLDDFTFIINLTGYTIGLVVPTDSPFKTLKDLVVYAKAHPDTVTFGSPGTGTGPHLDLEDFAGRAGIRLVHVPFKGSSQMLPNLLGGHVMIGTDTSGWAPYVESGKLRLLTTYGSKRTKRWPNVPTLKELGYGIESDSPYGIGGPKGMDPSTVKVIHDAFYKALSDPSIGQMFDRFDQSVIYMNPADYRTWAEKTFSDMGGLIKRLGLAGSI